MDITPEFLQEQIEAWKVKKHQLVAELNMLAGAIQSYERLLQEADDERVEETIDSDI